DDFYSVAWLLLAPGPEGIGGGRRSAAIPFISLDRPWYADGFASLSPRFGTGPATSVARYRIRLWPAHPQLWADPVFRDAIFSAGRTQPDADRCRASGDVLANEHAADDGQCDVAPETAPGNRQRCRLQRRHGAAILLQ